MIDHVFLVAVHPAGGREYEEAQSVGHSLRPLGEQPLAPTLFRQPRPLCRTIRELISSDQPRRDTLVSCSGNTRSTLVQLNQDQPERLYDTADVTYYVVAGEGEVRMNGGDTALNAGSFVSIPRGTAHALVHRGRRPLIVLVTLGGTPCEEPR